MRIGKKQIKGALTADLWIKAYESVLAPKSVTTLVSEANILDEDFADISDWTDDDYGTGAESLAVTFDSKSCMRLRTGTDTNGSGTRTRDVGTFGARTVVEFSLYMVTASPLATSDAQPFVMLSDGGKLLYITFGSDNVSILNTAGSRPAVGSGLPQLNVWQTWLLDLNWVTGRLDLYLNGSLAVSNVDFGYVYTSYANGFTRLENICGTTGVEKLCYFDWMKISNDGYTSVTISGLDGNVDEEYRALVKAVVGAPSTSIYIRPNNDSTTANYGAQWLRGSNTTLQAYRQTTGIGFYCHPWSGMNTGDFNLSDTLIYAKSGYMRTALTHAMAGSGTTINDVSLIDGLWTNTADNITSIVIVSDTTNGLGAGTSIEVWKKVLKI